MKSKDIEAPVSDRKIKDQFEITALPQNAGLARDRVKKAASELGFSKFALGDLEIAVGEAVTNAILYGSPTATSRIVVCCYVQENGNLFTVEVTDQGKGFDPSHIRAEEETDALGGRGIRLMRALSDKLLLYYDSSGMTVQLSKRIDASPVS